MKSTLSTVIAMAMALNPEFLGIGPEGPDLKPVGHRDGTLKQAQESAAMAVIVGLLPSTCEGEEHYLVPGPDGIKPYCACGERVLHPSEVG